MTDAERKLQSKVTKQRTEIARLTQRNEKLVKERLELLKEIAWMKGES